MLKVYEESISSVSEKSCKYPTVLMQAGPIPPPVEKKVKKRQVKSFNIVIRKRKLNTMSRQHMHFPKSVFNRHYGPQLISFMTIIDFIDYWQDHIAFLTEFKIVSSTTITQLAESKSVKAGLAAGLFKLYSW
jgi:hypothetical protein